MKQTIKKFDYTQQATILVAVDCIIFGFIDGSLQLLLFKRRLDPFKNEWSLIGSFVNEKEGVQAAAARVLTEYTGLQNIYLEELGCFGEPARDAGGRVISIAHYAFIRPNEEDEELVAQSGARWFKFDELPSLILDHAEMAQQALAKLRSKARYRPIGFELLPTKFTIPQLKMLYDTIYQKDLDRRNFRKKILSMGILQKLEEKDKSGSRKGAFLYSFDKEKYEALSQKGFNFEL